MRVLVDGLWCEKLCGLHARFCLRYIAGQGWVWTPMGWRIANTLH